MTTSFVKRQIPTAIFSLLVIILILDYFLNIPGMDVLATALPTMASIIAAFALILGVVSSVQMHTRYILSKKREQWPFSIWLIVVMVITIILNYAYTPGYDFVFKIGYQEIQSTMYTLLAFYLGSAAYRTLRARTLEAAVLLVSAIIIMFVLMPAGTAIWPYSSNIYDWIMQIPNTAGVRGIVIGAAIGLIGLTFRVMIGRERAPVGGGS